MTWIIWRPSLVPKKPGLPARVSAMMSTKRSNTPPNPKLPPAPAVPGGAASLPEGALPKPFLGPQGDENRDPPAGAPAPVSPTETVKDTR
jgi:hypothetical protein